MNLHHRLVIAVLVTLAVGRLGYGAPARAILPLSKVVPGQRAIAKSVFKGTKIESFNLEIIGVIPRFNSGTHSVILARILDGPVVKRQSAIIEGMSGSPVYIQGKLIGAIAYGWQYSKEPIAGIQPIEYMLEAWRPADKPAAPPAPAKPVTVGGRRVDRVQLAPGPAGQKDPPGTITLRPLGGLLQVSGLNARAAERLTEGLRPYGLRAVAGPGGGGALDKMHPPLVPGASIGALLVRGDVDMAGMGTVTYVEDGKVLAFGHPFGEFGEVDFPLTGGYVYDIMPTLDASFKIMAPTATVGHMYRDHTAAIAGEMKKAPAMLPVSVEVRDRGGPWRTYDFEVVRQRELMPLLVGSSVLGLVDEARTRVAKGSLLLKMQLDFKDRPSLYRTERSYSDSDAAAAAIPTVLAPLAVLSDNPFGPAPLTRVHLKLDYEDARNTATLERAMVSQSRYRAGDTVTIRLTVRPYGKAPITKPVQFTLPADLPRGAVRVVISSGKDATSARAGLGAPLPDPVNLEQMIGQYARRGTASDLVLQVALTRNGASLLGEELPDLPRSAYDVLQASRPSDLHATPTLLRVVTPTDWVLSGRQSLTLQVESDVSAGAARPIPGPPPPSVRPEPPSDGEDEGDSGDTSDLEDFSTPTPLSMATPAPSAKPAKKEEGAPEKEAGEVKPAPRKDEKPLTSAPPAWVQRVRTDYAKAKLKGVAVASDGTLSLAPSLLGTTPLAADAIWSVAVREGVAYVGTGAAGIIYQVSPTGEATSFFATGEMNVNALVFDAQGNLYAATSPHGRLYRITPDGKGTLFYQCERPHLWALAFGPDGTLYAGAGSPAGVYAISRDGKGKLVASPKGVHVLSLVVTAKGEIYAGTANAALLYRVKVDGATEVVTQASGSGVNALAQDNNGNLYLASTPGGEIMRVPASGAPEPWARTEQTTVYGMAVQTDGSLLAATGPTGVLVRVAKANEVQVLERPETGLVSALALAGDTLYLGRTTPTALRRLSLSGATSGELESAVLDAERPARWGGARAVADTPEGSAVTVETRSGDSADPNDRWSEWTPTATGMIDSPTARYLQYRLTLTREAGKLSPTVREVHLSRLAMNRPPTVTIKAPAGGASVSKKFTVKWDGRDPDRNDLIYDLALSNDMGKTWTTLKNDVTDPKYDWDTAKTAEGTYLLRVTASDRRSQPWTPQSMSDTLAVTVDNTAPTLLLADKTMAVGDDRRVKLSGLVTDKLTSIVSVEYRVDGGPWHTVPFTALDSPMTDFSFTTDPLDGGQRKIEVHAFDAAGNVVTEKAAPTVPPGASGASASTSAKPEAAPSTKSSEETPSTDEEPAASEDDDSS